MTASPFRRPGRRREWFRDYDGVWATTKRDADERRYYFDELDPLGGAVIVAVEWDSNGPSLTGTDFDDTSHSVLVGRCGEATVTVTTSRDPETLAEACALLNSLKTAFNAHAASATYHSGGDVNVSAAAATTFATAVTLADELAADFDTHRASGAAHPIVDTTNDVTAASGATTLALLITQAVDIRDQYLAHIRDTSHAYHLTSPDGTNVPDAVGEETLTETYRWIAREGGPRDYRR